MHVRDRIRELRRVPARELRPNPKNWRTHPARQRDALRGVLADIGYAGALLARELPDGSLELIDGHLRAETTPEAAVPVLVLDVTAEEADKLLATFDPLSGLAGIDPQALENLLKQTQFESQAVEAMLRNTAAPETLAEHAPVSEPREVEVPKLFQVTAECRDESQQRELFERLTAEGFKCRLTIL